MYVNPWEEESDYVSSHTSTPAPSGCPPLPFAPQIGFEPSLARKVAAPEADGADGNTFNLNLPQAGESAPGATAGRTLTCEQGSWENSPTGHSYEWLHNGAAISGATSETYTLKEADQGMAVQCEVKAAMRVVALRPYRDRSWSRPVRRRLRLCRRRSLWPPPGRLLPPVN